MANHLGEDPLLSAFYCSLHGDLPVLTTAGGEQARLMVLSKIRRDEYGFEEAPCLCGSRDERLICTVDRYRIPHRTVLCINCGLVRTNPRLTVAAYSDFYRHYYRAIYERPNQSVEHLFCAQARNACRRHAFIAKHLTWTRPWRVLEIGCGGGWNLVPFKEAGHQCVGYDYDHDYLGYGRERGLGLREGGLREALEAGESFDIVILSHVLEHFLDPFSELRAIRRLVQPAGMLFVEVPNLFAVTNALLRYFQSAHTYSFVPATLRELMTKAGFREVALTSTIASVWRLTEPASEPWPPNIRLVRRTERFLLRVQTDSTLRAHWHGVKARMARLCRDELG